MIRYFATNRSIADLEASTDRRSERLQLQTGGYYFVDMERYMAFYLGEVEPSVMPKSAIVKNSDADIFSSFLTKKEIESIVVCVHGFNVELFEAFTWFRILTETMRNASPNGSRVVTHPADIAADGRQAPLTAFIGFSWPSNGDVFSYMSDQREAVGSAVAFASLLSRLRSTGKSVKLLCHSMGNYLACNALKMLINKESSPPHLATNGLSKLMDRIDRRKDDGTHDAERLVDTFVMIAPDVERRHVVKAAGHDAETNYVGPFYSGLEHLVGKAFNVYSRFDGALNVSDLEKKPREALHSVGDALSSVSFGLLDFLERNPDQKWEKRLGSAPHPPSAPNNFASINATEVAGRKIDHSDHIDSAALARCIADCLEI